MPFVAFLRLNAPWLAAGALLSFLSSFGQTFFISIFAGEVRGAFGLGHGAWGTIYMIGTLASAAVMVWAGTLTDRYRVRALGSVVLLGLALSCVLMASAHTVWVLIVAIFALRFTGQGMISHTGLVAVTRWFTASRGKALSVSRIGFSVGEALLPLSFVALMAVVDWRRLWLVAAGVCIVSIPLLFALLRRERLPGSFAGSEESAGMGARHWRRAEVVRHPLFWLALPAMIGPPAFITVLFFNQVYLSEVKGWSHAGFVGLFPAYTALTIAASFGFGWAVDRFGVARLGPMMAIPFAVGFAAMGAAPDLSAAMLSMAALAVGNGAMNTLPPVFWASFFGTRHIGSIKSLAASVMVLGSAVGPGMTGVLIDAGLDLPAQLWAFGAWFVFAAGALGWGMVRFGGQLAAPA